MNMFFRLILYLIHKCIDFVYFFRLLFKDLKYERFIQQCMSLIPNFLRTQTFKHTKQICLNKMPLHLGIIVSEERISLSDLSNLIIWSFHVGINHISIYDSKGFIKSNGIQLYKEADHMKNVLLKKKADCFNIIFNDGKAPYLYNTIAKNGHKIEDINVYLLSHADGKKTLVQATKKLCQDVRKQNKNLQNFYAKSFDGYVKEIVNIPDPELLVIFGATSGLGGYLPWHIRLSEIIFQTTHHNFSIKEFHSVLQRYSKCEKRFGK